MLKKKKTLQTLPILLSGHGQFDDTTDRSTWPSSQRSRGFIFRRHFLQKSRKNHPGGAISFLLIFKFTHQGTYDWPGIIDTGGFDEVSEAWPHV